MTSMKPLGLLVAAAMTLGTPLWAETRITYKSAKVGSSYYQMGVQIAEAMKSGSDGSVSVTVEESQGSVQNVMEVRARGADYVFTTPPALVGLAQGGKAMFEGKGDPAFDEIRALFSDPVADHAFRNVARQRRAKLCRYGRQDHPAWKRLVRGPGGREVSWVSSALKAK